MLDRTPVHLSQEYTPISFTGHTLLAPKFHSTFLAIRGTKKRKEKR
ncbi:hypothetical protein HMPREF1869_01501 [Bacteroidales bacterium KA00251]|nr:hypothetical protein HMPREF1869_01501 [Bacteroidales bacterium KA00251]